jgi:hypothetical protein
MKKYILSMLLIISTLTTYAQSVPSLWVKQYVNGIGGRGGEKWDTISSGQPFIFSVDITNIGGEYVEETDTMWFRYFFDYRWYRPNGKLNQNYPIYEKPISKRIPCGETVHIQLDTIYMHDSLLLWNTSLEDNWHRTGVCLVRYNSVLIFPDSNSDYWFVFKGDSNKLGTQNLIPTHREAKLLVTYDMLGRSVKKIEVNVPYIFVYDNGQRKKVIIEKN